MSIMKMYKIQVTDQKQSILNELDVADTMNVQI